MQTLLQDVRCALRGLRKQPAFTSIALVTLALGIGANTAIFSVVHSVLLEPLPFGQPEELVQIWESRVERGWNRSSMTHANFWDFRELNRTFEDIGSIQGTSLNLTGTGYPERLRAGRVSAGFLRILRVAPVLGRTFLPEEDQPGAENRVVVLGNELWRGRFGADSAIVGSSLILDGEGYTVVGVLPVGEPWLNTADVFVPFVQDPEADRVSFELNVIGRLAPGISMETARSDLESVARRLEELYPEENAGMGADIAPSSDWVASADLRLALWVLLGAVGFLLLIACVNLANLLLARATARMRETAVRAALGADRRRIARQVLTESLVLAFIGAGMGLLLAVWGIRLFRALDPAGIPRVAEVGLNMWVLGFTVLTALVSGILSGLFPALMLPIRDLAGALREGGRGSSGGRLQKRLRNALVAAEVALSLTLVVGAALLIRSFVELLEVERGFETEDRLVAAVNLSGSYDGPRTRDFLVQFVARLEADPRVRSAAAISLRPLVGGSTGMGILPVGQPEDPEDGVPWAGWRLVTGEYFEAMGIPLLRGRTFRQDDEFSPMDTLAARPRVLISQRLADLFWPEENPIGREVNLWQGQDGIPAEIIGVVGNMRDRALDIDPSLTVYLPYYGLSWSPIHFVLHTDGNPTALVPAMRSMLAELDPSLPLSMIQTMEEIVVGSVATRRLNMLLLGIFAGVALVLALAGIYGVQSYSVTRRTSEIGIRVALGARSGTVIRQVIEQGMRPALLGIGLGLLGALGLSRLMSSLLFEIAPGDPATYVGVALVLGAAALLACYLPARRALRIDPSAALRQE